MTANGQHFEAFPASPTRREKRPRALNAADELFCAEYVRIGKVKGRNAQAFMKAYPDRAAGISRQAATERAGLTLHRPGIRRRIGQIQGFPFDPTHTNELSPYEIEFCAAYADLRYDGEAYMLAYPKSAGQHPDTLARSGRAVRSRRRVAARIAELVGATIEAVLAENPAPARKRAQATAARTALPAAAAPAKAVHDDRRHGPAYANRAAPGQGRALAGVLTRATPKPHPATPKPASPAPSAPRWAIDPSDVAALIEVAESLEAVATSEGVPEAIRSLAERALHRLLTLWSTTDEWSRQENHD